MLGYTDSAYGSSELLHIEITKSIMVGDNGFSRDLTGLHTDAPSGLIRSVHDI